MKTNLSAVLTLAALTLAPTLTVFAQDVAPATDVPISSAPTETPVAAQQPTPTAEAAPMLSGRAAELDIAGRTILRIRTGAGGQTAQERVANIGGRVGAIQVLPELKPRDVRIVQTRPGQDATIYVRDLILVTVDRDLARVNNTTPEALAEKWAQNMRDVLPRIVVVGVPKTATAATAALPPASN